MTYNFKDKTVAQIIEAFSPVVYSLSSQQTRNEAFNALQDLAPSVRRQVMDTLENELVDRVARGGRKLWNHPGDMESLRRSEYPSINAKWDFEERRKREKKKLMTELRYLCPAATALADIYRLKGNGAKPWTRQFVTEFLAYYPSNKRDAKAIARVVIDIKVDPCAEPEQTAAMKQQKLKEGSAGHKIRIIRKNNVGPGL